MGFKVHRDGVSPCGFESITFLYIFSYHFDNPLTSLLKDNLEPHCTDVRILFGIFFANIWSQIPRDMFFLHQELMLLMDRTHQNFKGSRLTSFNCGVIDLNTLVEN